MTRPQVLLLLCCSLLLPMPAEARLPGPVQAVAPGTVRDLAQIRGSRVLKVLVNQSRNSSGEVQGQPIGVCLLYTSPSPRDLSTSRMPSSA